MRLSVLLTIIVTVEAASCSLLSMNFLWSTMAHALIILFIENSGVRFIEEAYSKLLRNLPKEILEHREITSKITDVTYYYAGTSAIDMCTLTNSS
jgi:hypothetical protein